MIYLLKPESSSSSSHYELPQSEFNFFCSVRQTMYMEVHWLTAHQPTPTEDGVRTSPLVVSFCSIQRARSQVALQFSWFRRNSGLSLRPHWRTQTPAEALYAGWMRGCVFCTGVIITQQMWAYLHSGRRSDYNTGTPATQLRWIIRRIFATVVTYDSNNNGDLFLLKSYLHCMQAKGRLLPHVG